MPKINGLPDLSRFVRRENTVHIHNTVQLVVGVTSVEVNGYIISQKSQKLENLVAANNEIYMDQFVGDETAFHDVIELLYGADVKFTNVNIKTIAKFGAIYEVDDMYQLSVDWIRSNLSDESLPYFIEIGLMIKEVAADNQDVLDMCKHYITETVRDELTMLSEMWPLSKGIVKFLLQDEIIYFALPIITRWINSDSDIQLVLDQAELNDVNIFQHGARSLSIRNTMIEKVEVFETSKRLLQLRETYVVGTAAEVPGPSTSRVSDSSSSSSSSSQILTSSALNSCLPLALPIEVGPSSEIPITPLSSRQNWAPRRESIKNCPARSYRRIISNGLDDLLAMDYHSFSVKKMLTLEQEYNLTHYQYVDMLLSRVRSKGMNMSQKDVMQLWASIKLEELEFYYMALVRKGIINAHPRSRAMYLCPIPDFSSWDTRRNQTLSGSFLLESDVTDLLQNKTVNLKVVTKGTCSKRNKHHEERVMVQVMLKRTSVNHRIKSRGSKPQNWTLLAVLVEQATWECDIDMKHCWIIEVKGGKNRRLHEYDPFFQALATSRMSQERRNLMASKFNPLQGIFYNILDFNRFLPGTDLKTAKDAYLVLCIAHECRCQ